MTTPRLARCRVTDRCGGLCTAEALDPDAEILICAGHAAAVLRLITEQQGITIRASRRKAAA